MLIHKTNRIETPQCCGDRHLWDDLEAPVQGLQDLLEETVKGFHLGLWKLKEEAPYNRTQRSIWVSRKI